jgi:hypothetical protein
MFQMCDEYMQHYILWPLLHGEPDGKLSMIYYGCDIASQCSPTKLARNKISL